MAADSLWRPREAALRPIPLHDVLAVTVGEEGPRACVLSVLTVAATLHMRAESAEAAMQWALYLLAATGHDLQVASSESFKNRR